MPYFFLSTGVLSRELGAAQIRINALNLGAVDTEGSRAVGILGSDAEKMMVAQTPLGRTGLPDDIAAIAVFLASDESDWLTGEQFLADGGMR